MRVRTPTRFLLAFLRLIMVFIYFGPAGLSKGQLVPPIGCRGLSGDRCSRAIGILQKALEEHEEWLTDNIRMVEKWEIADAASLAGMTKIRSARTDGNYGSKVGFAAFFVDQNRGLTFFYPNYVLVSTEVVDPEAGKLDSAKMAYIAGFLEGANQGHAMQVVYDLRKK